MATTSGVRKRSPPAEYLTKGRATGGVSTIQLAPKTSIAGAAVMSPGEDALLVTESGKTTRVTPADVPRQGRDRKGAPLFKLDGSDAISRLVVLLA